MKESQMTISARVPEDLGQQVDELATALKRNRSWVIEEALRAYVSREMQFLAAVREGIEAYERGEVVPHSQVVEEIRNWRPAEK